MTINQSPHESLRSYVQRFNAESLKVDVPDEKFAITAFIVGLGVQSKDLMFSISKHPQANMAEVLTKAEKYINGEEDLTSKRGSSSTHKEKSRTDKQGSEALGNKEIERDLQGGTSNDPRRGEEALETVWDHLSPSYVNGIHLCGSPPDNHSITGLTRSTA